MNSTLRKISLAALVALPLLHGCGSNSSSTGSGNVRLVNATSEYPSLDLTGASGNGVSTGVKPFTPGSYGGVDAGTQTLYIKATGASGTGVSGGYPIGKDTSYSIVAYVSPDNALTGALSGAFLDESAAAPTTSATAKLRIHNTVYNRSVPNDTDKLDAYVATASCADPAAIKVAGGTPPSSGFTEIPAAAAGTLYHVCITGISDRSDLRLDLPAVTLKDKQITTLVLTPTPGGVLVNGVQVDQGGTTVTPHINASTRVRLVADAALGGSVSASIGGVVLAADTAPLSSPRVGGYVLVPADASGVLAASARINGGTAVTASVPAVPGTDLTLLVTGTAAAPVVTRIADNNRTPTSATSAKVRVVNGINGLPAGSGVDLTANNVLAASNVAFRSASTPFLAAAATAAVPSSLGVTSGTLVVPSGSSVATTSVYKGGTDAVLVSGKVYTVFVLGDATNVTNVLIREP